MNNRPPYFYSDSSAIMHSPLELQQADMYGYFIKGKLTNLQKTVDESLNTVANGKINFKVLSPYVLTTFTRVAHANSAVEVDKNKGWITEVDIVTWIMVREINSQDKLSHVYWYPCHIFVNDGMALINGRELFGYPKYLCEYEIPKVGEEPLLCSLSVKGFKSFSKETEIKQHKLLSVKAVKKDNPHRPIKTFTEFLTEAFTLLKSMPDFLNLDAAGWEDVISLLLKPRIDQLFLKQFPDSAGVKAVYQALLTAPAVVDKIHHGALLGYEYQATLESFDSFPLDKSLGFNVGESPAILPFNLNFDFTVTQGKELIDNSQLIPEKIAILGGGVSAMTSAYYLTSQPDWQKKYDITVYQMGWRLGGKGASGRNADYGQRIEEHGLHIWFGFYENAFAMIKEAYELMGRPEGAALGTWQDAFKPHDFISLAEDINGEWKPWSIVFPKLPGVPGDESEHIDIWKIIVDSWEWIKKWLEQLHKAHNNNSNSHIVSIKGQHDSWLHQLAGVIEQDVDHLGSDIKALVGGLHTLITNMPKNIDDHNKDHHKLVLSAVEGIAKWIEIYLEREIEHELMQNDDLRRLYICINLGTSIVIGMLKDDVLTQGFNVINNLDFRAWLLKHGASERYSVDSAPVRGFYDLIFAYEKGNFLKPNVEAGTMLRAMMRIALCYQGSIMFKMQAGMGDTIFTPMYQVLRDRGVKFKFFHKVEELVPVESTIDEIRITKQVAVNAGDLNYDPFVYVKDLACWPSVPNYLQINSQQSTLLKSNNINLESNWSAWPKIYQENFKKPLEQIVLKKGKDFDRIVFGISIASIEQLCPQLLQADAKLKLCTDKVKTVATQAYQVWLNQDLTGMGWPDQPEGQEPVLSAFSEPYDTWASMSQLLCREDWPVTLEPKNVSYFCSALPIEIYPPVDDYDFPARCSKVAKQGAISQLNKSIGGLWKNAGEPGEFKWQWLIDADENSGYQRFDSQFWRANIDPSERYVMSVVDSTQHRISTDGTIYSNLFMTGDWIFTGLNAGCVEAAVMAGMQTSRAISGYPKIIKGETDFK